MASGVTSGPFETYTEFRGGDPQAVAENATFTWSTQVTLPKGTWFVELFTYFAVRNVNMAIRLIAEGQIYGPGAAVHNFNGSPSLAVVTLPSLLTDVVVSSGKPQDIKVSLRGGPGGGAFGSQGIALLAWKVKPKKAASTRRTKSGAKSGAKTPTKAARRPRRTA